MFLSQYMLAKINPIDYLEKKGILCGVAEDAIADFIGIRYSDFEDVIEGRKSRKSIQTSLFPSETEER